MNSDFWIHLTIFLTVFVFTGIVLSRKKKKKDKKNAEFEYEEIQAEIFEPEDIILQAEQDTTNPYEILGVHKNDSLETIDNVYRKLIDIYQSDSHPEANHLSRDQKKELTAQINAAYSWLIKYHKINKR